MIWKIVSYDNSVFAKRLNRMFGIEVCLKPEGRFDGLFFFNMAPAHLSFAHKYHRIPKICYWTGMDARLFVEDKNASADFGNALHVTDSPLLVGKLSQKVSSPCFLPIPPYLPNLDIGIERPAGILMYLTDHKARDIERSKAFIKQIHDIPIYMLHGKGKKVVDGKFQDNIIDLDWIEDEARESIFRKVSVHIRLMHYDGLSQTVVEMKMLGRHVFYTEIVPYCNPVEADDSPSDIAELVRQKIDAPLDIEGAEYYRRVFSKENFLKIITELCALKGWDFPYGIV